MTHWPTCRICIHNKACEKQDAIKAKISGLGVTTIKLLCLERRIPYEPGSPVLVETVAGGETDEHGGPWRDTFPGHFIHETKERAIVFIKLGAVGIYTDAEFEPLTGGKTGFCKIPFSRLTPNPDGHPIEACSFCGEKDPECNRHSWDCPFKKTDWNL